MTPRPERRLAWLAVVLLAAPAAADEASFDRLCAPCHGPEGRGDGPAAHLYWPPPRDLVAAPFALGDDPASIARTLRRGIPGTGMPWFAARGEDAIAALVDQVIRLRGGAGAPRPPPPAPPPDLPARAARGEAVWREAGCAGCHGPEGAGDGPAAARLQAGLYDLRTAPLKGGDDPRELFATITHGRPGTPMLPFGEVLSTGDRWALVAALRARRAAADRSRADDPGAPPCPDASDAPGQPPRRLPPAGVRPRPAASDRLWPSRPLPPQGPPPPSAVPARRALDAPACGRCHPRKYEAWRRSRHAHAMGPGVWAQLVGHADPATCTACHAPLAEQQTRLPPAPEGAAPLGGEGVGCAACHVRGHVKLGPPVPARRRLPAPGLRATPEPRLARSDTCLPCHNLPLTAAVEGRPLLDTWREWAASPYLPAGIQCQHCHLPDGDHRFAGAHDPEAVRRAVRLDLALLEGSAADVRAEARVHNVAVGHHFPTTATPRAVLRVRQLDAAGRPLPGTESSWALGRTVSHDGHRWREIADTRVPAGATARRTYARPRHPDAARLEASLHFFPDWFYARFFRERLRDAPTDPRVRRAYEAALADAEASAFLVAWERRPLP